MKNKNKKENTLRTVFPNRPFLIYPTKYNELFLVLPICFVMFFAKGGGWAYSILTLITWFVFAILWSKRYWERECLNKGNYKLYIGDKWINEPEPENTDFHKDSPHHKLDELHFVYDSKNKRWKSHEELIEETEEQCRQSMFEIDRKLYRTCLRNIEVCHYDEKKRGF